LTTSKTIYSKEEVISNRQQNVSKTGSNGKNLSMQPIVGNLRVKKDGSNTVVKPARSKREGSGD